MKATMIVNSNRLGSNTSSEPREKQKTSRSLTKARVLTDQEELLAACLRSLTYDPVTGQVTHNTRGVPVNVDELYNTIVFYDRTTKKKYKVRIDKIAYMMGYKKVLCRDENVLHKNLDENDNTLRNICAVPKAQYKQIVEAKKNLGGDLKILPHYEDQYSYVVQFRKNNILVKESRYDIIGARKRMRQLEVAYAKLLHKYCVFDKDQDTKRQ